MWLKGVRREKGEKEKEGLEGSVKILERSSLWGWWGMALGVSKGKGGEEGKVGRSPSHLHSGVSS